MSNENYKIMYDHAINANIKLSDENNYLKLDNERLNNIINEFDKWLENEIKFQEIVENAHFLRKARIKLQELKGDGSNE